MDYIRSSFQPLDPSLVDEFLSFRRQMHEQRVMAERKTKRTRTQTARRIIRRRLKMKECNQQLLEKLRLELEEQAQVTQLRELKALREIAHANSITLAESTLKSLFSDIPDQLTSYVKRTIDSLSAALGASVITDVEIDELISTRIDFRDWCAKKRISVIKNDKNRPGQFSLHTTSGKIHGDIENDMRHRIDELAEGGGTLLLMEHTEKSCA